MSQELVYTSAQKGLKPGTVGFCTVAMTRDLPEPVAGNLESLSGYRHLFALNDPQKRENPVNFGHWIFSVRGRTLHVLGRIGPAPADYSGRTNKIAHYLVLSSSELPDGGPAWLLRQPGLMQDTWSGEPCWLDRGREIPRGDRSPAPCNLWKTLVGDAGWAGVLVQSFVEQPDLPVYIMCRPGENLLGLFEEALSLLPVHKRWDVSFSTYFNGLPVAGMRCHWRGVYAGTQQADEIGARALVIDLTHLPKTIPSSRYVDAARKGIPIEIAPAAATVAKQPALNSKPQPAAVTPSTSGFRVEDLLPMEEKPEYKRPPPSLPASFESWSASTRRNLDEANVQRMHNKRFPWIAAVFIFLVLLFVLGMVLWLMYRNMVGGSPPLRLGLNPGQNNPAIISPNGPASPSTPGVAGSGAPTQMPNIPSLPSQSGANKPASGSSNAVGTANNNSPVIPALVGPLSTFFADLNAAPGEILFQIVHTISKAIFTPSGPASGLMLTNAAQGSGSLSAIVPGVQAVHVQLAGAAASLYNVLTPDGQQADGWNTVPNDRTLELDVVLKGGAGGLALSNSAQTPVAIQVNGQNISVTTNQISLSRQTADALDALRLMVVDCRLSPTQYVRLQFLNAQPVQLNFSLENSPFVLQDATGNKLSGDMKLQAATVNADSGTQVDLAEATADSAVLELTSDTTGTSGVNVTFNLDDAVLTCDYSDQLILLQKQQDDFKEGLVNDQKSLQKLKDKAQLSEKDKKELNDLSKKIRTNQHTLENIQNQIQLLQSLEDVKLRLDLYSGGPVIAYIDFKP
ncbi:MAG TPA: hypothetical protein VMG59_10510 [Phycisphaerae bacterium]|nr:hypothetical protein [Phycisphaerae bacterium]